MLRVLRYFVPKPLLGVRKLFATLYLDSLLSKVVQDANLEVRVYTILIYRMILLNFSDYTLREIKHYQKTLGDTLLIPQLLFARVVREVILSLGYTERRF